VQEGDDIQYARTLRKQGKLHEALLSANRAAREHPTDASAFWEVSECLIALDRHNDAIAPLERVTELAPAFAMGWTRLGLAYWTGGDSEKAKENLEVAIGVKPDEPVALRALASIYEDEKKPDDEMRVLRAITDPAELSDGNLHRLGMLHYERKEFFAASRMFRTLATERKNVVGLFNLAVVLTEPGMHQQLDASDALRFVLAETPNHDRARKLLGQIARELIEARGLVQKLKQPILPKAHWYHHYVNPLELLNFPQGSTLKVPDQRDLLRAKKQLLQEIDLEDGAISWMPGLRIDRSRAIGICEQLNSDDLLRYHLRVHQNGALSGFLQRGELSHFLYTEDEFPEGLIQILHAEPEFAAWLSKIFAPQFDLLVTKCIETANVAALRCILSGRRWVQALDDERCFESAHAEVDLTLQPLRDAALRAEKTKPTLRAVQDAISLDKAGEILSLLPPVFHRHQREAATLIRQISLASHNAHDDSVLAKEILSLLQPLAAHLPSIRTIASEDSKTLDTMIAEKKKHEVHLTLGKASLRVTSDIVQLGESSIPTDQVRRIRWGVLLRDGAALYGMVIGTSYANEIKIEWRATKNLEDQDRLFASLVEAAINYFMPRIIDHLKREMAAGNSIQIGSLRVSQGGVAIPVKSWFSTQIVIVPWTRVMTEIKNGVLFIGDRANAKARAQLELISVDNAIALHLLAKLM